MCSATMPYILKLRVVEARDLPVMDKRSDSTDAYVDVLFGEIEESTKVVRCVPPLKRACRCSRVCALQ